MDELRMGLGTDQLELPPELAADIAAVTLLPPTQRSEMHLADTAEPDQAALAELAPWADSMQLPGVDT